jgi:hypothetical protein
MKHRDLIGECWAGHEAFRRYGFTPDQIKVYCGKIESLKDEALAAVLEVSGKRFVYVAGNIPAGVTLDEIYDEWTEFVEKELAGIPESELVAFWQKSCVGQSEETFGVMGVGLMMKGFDIPNLKISAEEKAAMIQRVESLKGS